MKENSPPISDCCQKPMKTDSNGGTTRFYICSGCNKPCSPYDDSKGEIDTTSPTWKDGYKTGKKEEGLASFLREKKIHNEAIDEAMEIVERQQVESWDDGAICLRKVKEKLRSLIHKK